MTSTPTDTRTSSGGSRGRPSGSRPAARPSRPRPPRPAPRPSRALKGLSAALVAALVGLVLVTALALVIWVGEPRTSAPIGDVLRTSGAFWLLGHGARLHLPDGSAGLVPLGLSLVFAALARRAGAKVAKVRPAARRGRAVLGCAVCVAVPYAVTAALVATVVSDPAVRVSSQSAALGAFVVALLGAAFGAARALPRTGTDTGLVRAVGQGLVTAFGVLLAASALCTALMLVTHLSDAADLARPEKAGVVGGIGLLAIQLGLAPNVLAWTGAYVLGPGFSIGAGTVVSPTRVQLGDVPGLPMLAGLPGSAVPWPVYVLFVVGPAAGVLAGLVAVRRLPRTPRWGRTLALGASIAVAVGVLAGVIAAASGGPVAAGRLATVGPSPLSTAAFAALEIGVPALLTVLGLVAYRRYRLTHADAESASVAERLAGWRTAAAAKVSRPVRGLRLRRGQEDDLDDMGDESDDKSPTVVIDLTEVDSTKIDLTKHDKPGHDEPEPTSDTVDLTAAAGPVIDLTKHDDVPGWDAELTQPLDLTGLQELVAAQAGDEPGADGEPEADSEPADEPTDDEPAARPRRRLLRRRT